MASNKESENNGIGGEFNFRRPEQRTKWESIKRAIYDPSTKEFCGRTGKNWGQLLIFYTIFYAVLAALFAVCMQGLIASLDEDAPTWQLDSSLIGTNPGLGFRPISERTEEGSLIWYNSQNDTSLKKWVDILDNFLEVYRNNQTGGNFQQCDFDKQPDEGHVCVVDLEQFGPCSPKNSYGYKTSSPCVFLKLNKIFGWVPDYYTEPENDMPDELKTTISHLPDMQRKQVWISCNGEGPSDMENIKGFNYFPKRGFPGFYYPYTNTKNYLSPLIAVQVIEPTKNLLVNIECRAWAKNINYRGGNLQREGSIHFEILRD